jgi:hypothetical protein
MRKIICALLLSGVLASVASPSTKKAAATKTAHQQHKHHKHSWWR